MKIGIIGSGNIGETTARLFVNAGAESCMLAFGDDVLLALPWRKNYDR